MSKTANDFVKKLKKLDNYFILREEDGYFIIGTTINIKEHIEIRNTFSIYVANKDRKIWSFFILALEENADKVNEFRKRKLPILILLKNIANAKMEVLKNYLDDFINKR